MAEVDDTGVPRQAKRGGALVFVSHQYVLGQAIFCDVTLQISRQLHGQRTYFFPTGAFLIGYKQINVKTKTCFLNQELVRSIRGFSCPAHRSFTANVALNHVLVGLAFHRYGGLTDSAADERSAAAVRAALRRVRRRRLSRHHRAGERC